MRSASTNPNPSPKPYPNPNPNPDPNPNPNPNPKPNPNPNPKLQARGAGLFDGAVYAGSAGVEVGLVDAIGEISSDMCKRFGRHVQLVNMEPEEPVDYGRLLRWLF